MNDSEINEAVDNITAITNIGLATKSAPEDIITALKEAKIKFVKKTWRHREQERAFKQQLRELVAKQRPLFETRKLADDNKVRFTKQVDVLVGYTTTGRDIVDIKTVSYPKRCGVCLDPADYEVLCVEDSTYRSWLCEAHKNK